MLSCLSCCQPHLLKSPAGRTLHDSWSRLRCLFGDWGSASCPKVRGAPKIAPKGIPVCNLNP